MPAPLLTLRAVAHALRLPESTVRYYRDAFGELLPTEGRGRRRRHPPEVVPLFELIAEGFAANWSRDDVRAALAERLNGTSPAARVAAGDAGAPLLLRPAAEPAEGVLALVLEGERERREALWHMAREILRLGEAVERQHAVLSEIARQLERRETPRLPPAERAGREAPPRELDALREELARERELVERLRRSKLELERRTAEAEAALAEPRDGGLRRMFGARPRGTDTS
jgi:DNA-binding transcriptional MerR regulator